MEVIVVWNGDGMADEARAHVIFRGKVQGVFFRANTEGRARELGLKGWVRNLPDGSVESVFEGPREAVKKAIEWCKSSQPHARVTDADIDWEDYRGEFSSFEVRY
ncbi:MAG: acylphosphatase [Thermoplasmata archaeon]